MKTEKKTRFFVAPVTVEDGTLTADIAAGLISVRVTDAVDRMPSGLRAAEVFAVWEVAEKGQHATDIARMCRPDRLLIHVGGGEMLRLADEYRIEMGTEN